MKSYYCFDWNWALSPDYYCRQLTSKTNRYIFAYGVIGFYCRSRTLPLGHQDTISEEDDLFIVDFEVDQGMPVFQIGGGLNFKVYLYDPSVTSMTTWDKSYSFDIGPGFSYKLGLSIRKFKDQSGFSDCIEEGKMKWELKP